MRRRLTLVGDGIENPWNAQTMIDAAGMFGSPCLFRDRKGLAAAWKERIPAGDDPAVISYPELARDYAPIIAVDNLPSAVDVYGFALAGGPQPAVVVGNERRGIAEDVQSIAQHAVQIPLLSRKLNCLNVAAASAVALFYLWRGGGGKLQRSVHPHKRRPELVLIGAGDHVELGSTIRSAGAFGWERVFVEDRAGVWFTGDRGKRSVGRAAARRGRNPIHVIPAPQHRGYAFGEVCVVTTRERGTPLHRAHLAKGPQQLIAIPDEGRVDFDGESWSRLGRAVTFAHLELPCRDYAYHYRLVATIALAEVARQVGQRIRPAAGRPRRQGPLYDRSLELLVEEQGQVVYLDDLAEY